MKKRMIMVMLVACLFFVGNVSARTAMVPEGTVVSARVDMEKKTATVTIIGLQPTGIEVYTYEGIRKLDGTSAFQVNLREGRRFQVLFSGSKGVSYFLLTPEMAKNPWAQDLFGKGIGLDCSSPDGCCFMVIAPK